MTVLQNLSRIAIAAALAFFTLVPTAPAEEVGSQVVAVPNARTFAYNLAPGAASAAIRVPSNIPIQVIGVCTTVGVRGVGQVSLLSIPGAGGFLEWVGLDSTAGAAITQGFSGVLGTKIVFIDFAHQVQIEVASATSLRVRNLSGGQRTGSVTLTW